MAFKQTRKSGVGSTGVTVVVVVILLVASVGGYVFLRSSTKPPSSTAIQQGQSTTGQVYARIQTSLGTIEVQLFPNSAPRTVANFVRLAEMGFYDELVWHRIVPGFVIQTGDPNTRNGLNSTRAAWGAGGSNATVPLEIDPSLHNDVGYLGMARGPENDSGSSQFYINLANNTYLDGYYTVFGRVISGMDVVNAIAQVPIYVSGPYVNQPISSVFMLNVTIQNTP
ncbi:MAG TPA: peptidylprolyl isomerase [Nitrososphaerales archaeon]|nr:peptidylprolyl isomerase [Nitrososphaerales archaeon]